MGKLIAYNFITLNGYYKGPDNDISWHRHGEEESGFASENMEAKATLLFGRVTYEMMASFWPTPMALEQMPDVAKGMNESEKIVFSSTLESVDWENTTIIQSDLVEAVRELKSDPDRVMTILGSGSIIAQLAEAGLIDEYQYMIDPVALGSGTPSFQGLTRKLDLKLTDSRIFKSGVVLLTYEPL
ncbi:dihydrofolate reductase family protein [Dyadobacter sp. CY261]|uniref:dihydrofolate reductase family protein n=1 Tax=Dyadobacter sp. CY261 TaxID=2907203 RepID=UPI001F4364FE|nr:dihydrofolate reductase family protein [Dyadobacter sp. CY261]MCF0069280.1 dihydrofolate reductase family protein [Dyadobacter sp. CY261]